MKKKQILILEVNEKNSYSLELIFKDSNTQSIFCMDELSKLDENIENFDLVLVNSTVNYINPRKLSLLVNDNFDLKIPIIYLSSSAQYDKGLLAECYQYGISDFIKKPFDSLEIFIRAQYHMDQMYKLRECRLRIDKLSNLATQDQLSKTFSRMHMQSILKHYLDSLKKDKFEVSIIYLNLTNIDKIVSIFGFNRGEQILSSFSKELKKLIRPSDVLSRWSGSEFMILLPKTSTDISKEVVKKINNSLMKIDIIKDTKPIVAYGIVELMVDDSIEDMVQRAKYALKEATKEEYGKVFIFC